MSTMSSVLKLSQQLGSLSLSTALKSGLPTTITLISCGKIVPKACISSVSHISPYYCNERKSSAPLTRIFSSLSATTVLPTDLIDLDSSDAIPEHIIPADVMTLLLQHPEKTLRPAVVRKRLASLKTYTGRQPNIRGSPWKLNLVCHLAAGLPVVEALNQLKFCNKIKAPLVAQVIQRTANLASIRDGLLPSQLEVATCFSTHGTSLKRIRYMAKGRHGKVRREHAHLNVTLREIDFDLKLVQSTTVGQMKRWMVRKAVALQEVEERRKEVEEVEELERRAKEIAEKKKQEAEKK